MNWWTSKEKEENVSDVIFKDDKTEEQSKLEKGNFLGFDALSLERAARAARELEGLKYAQEAINIAKLKEDRRKVQAKAEVEENLARQKAMEIEKNRTIEQERRQTLQADHKLKQEQAYYADQLSRKRHQDQLQQQAQARELQRKRDEEYQLRLESIKRQTIEYEAKLRKETERVRATAEVEAKTVQERKNWDLHMERSKMIQTEYRRTVIEGVREFGNMSGTAFYNFITNREKMVSTIGFLSALAVGIYGARAGTNVIGKYIESRIGKPSLVRETSRKMPLKKPISTVLSLLSRSTNPLEGIIVKKTLQERLNELAISTKNTKNNSAIYRNALLFGPPGTGKTLFAKQLAKSSGMDYAIMSGGDIAPLGTTASTEIHKLFDWANSSRKGLIVFIDEADAFLAKRSNENMSENQRNALNAFLYRTGTESKNFMLLYATNQPKMLDHAINDRTDEIVEFNLPELEQRSEMVRFYFEKYIINGHVSNKRYFIGSRKITANDVTDEMLLEAAEKMQGFSGRQIAKLGNAWQAAAYSSGNATLTKELFDRVLNEHIEQQVQKQKWN